MVVLVQISAPSVLRSFFLFKVRRQAEDKLHVWPLCPARFKVGKRGTQAFMGKRPGGGYEIQPGMEGESVGNLEEVEVGGGGVTPLTLPLHFPSDLITSVPQTRSALKCR